jgi:hypothetical protein
MLHGWIRSRFGGRIAIEDALRNDFAVAKREKRCDERLHPDARDQAHHRDSQDSSPLQFNGQFITRFKDAPDAISLRLQSLRPAS